MSGKIPASVMRFLDDASEHYGRIMAEHFSYNMYHSIIDNNIKSPIECLFYIALHVRCAHEYMEANPAPWFDERTLKWMDGFGIHVHQQCNIGKYRVDFLIRSTDGPQPNEVIVELDGHEFHDKNKAQRAYEKARDRYLVASGYKVLHYTGSEVVADPHKVAHEVLSLLGAAANSGDYSQSNPFGID